MTAPVFTFSVRRALEADSARIAAIWREAADALTKADARFQLANDADEQFRAALAVWIGHPQCAVFVATRADGEVIGYIIGSVTDNAAGFLPRQLGIVKDLAVDFHAKSGRIGRELFKALETWFSAQGIPQIKAEIAYRHPVAQAFWRAIGATKTHDTFWMKLD